MDISFGGVGEVAAAVGLSTLFKMRSCHRKTPITILQMMQKYIQAEKIVNSIRAKACDTIWPIPAVYHEEIQAIATRPDKEEVAAKLPTLAQLKSSLYRNRSQLPPMPESRTDVQL